MHSGFSSLGAVALRIMEDFGSRTRMNRYTLLQTLEKVVMRGESVASCHEDIPSYIWWYIGMDEYGDIAPIVDYGKLRIVPYGDRRFRYIWPKEYAENDGAWFLCVGEDWNGSDDDQSWRGPEALDVMVKLGLNFGQRVLTRHTGSWSSPSYYDNDVDEYHDVEIIYAEPSSRIDIPLWFNSFVPSSKKLTVL
jgi:hypothetical protein